MTTPNLKLYVLARVELQLSSLNASGAIGNYTKLQEGYVIVNTSRGPLHVPVPVITGNALKNWHARAMAETYVSLGGKKIHESHFADMYRLSLKRLGSEGEQKSKLSEAGLVNECSICDVHGYLIAEAGVQLKRESLIKFSFAVPVEEEVKQVTEQYLQLKFAITHNRVTADPKEMMLFKREYGSTVFGWETILDVASIGRSQFERNSSSNSWLGKPLLTKDGNKIAFDEITLRAKAAILAFVALLSGHLGANTSRALPLSKVVDLVVIRSNGSIPVPLHPFYEDYAKDLLSLVKSPLGNRIQKVYCLKYGKAYAELQNERSKLVEFDTYYGLLDAVAKDVEEALKPSQAS
ncbi:CRISPR-associated autoregulator, DevR family [Ignisphaera aggregans DSM 17230]|uniref:CRISPR-associated autoregulator, DevR family n=1 Tax=Ignisphaera aggregans (strain DSM 17230 / JCM 13409 / AQ1.S1) TaxID=583356 RepID=E0STW4_IGNAA|nr:CRISPR-associated autoregulator, DevR family [Ignisphaera aggregans DSM 17230]